MRSAHVTIFLDNVTSYVSQHYLLQYRYYFCPSVRPYYVGFSLWKAMAISSVNALCATQMAICSGWHPFTGHATWPIKFISCNVIFNW